MLKQGATSESMKKGMAHVSTLPGSQTTSATGVSQKGKTTGAKAAAHIPQGTNK